MKNKWYILYAIFGMVATIGVALLEGHTIPQAMVLSGIIALVVTFIAHMIYVSQ